MYDWQQTSPSCFPKNGKQNSSGFGGYGQPYQTYNNNIGFNHHMSRYQVYQGYQGHSNGGEGEKVTRNILMSMLMETKLKAFKASIVTVLVQRLQRSKLDRIKLKKKTSPQAKRRQPSLLFTSLAISTSLIFITR